MVPSAYLRVLQPLDGFERQEQLHWERWLVTGRQAAGRPRYADRTTGPGVGLLAPAGPETADVRVFEGRTYLAPHRMRLRVLETIVAFREEQPVEMWDAFVPKREARRARRQLAHLRRRDPLSEPFVQQSAWHVPLRWFVLFRPEERTIADDAAILFYDKLFELDPSLRPMFRGDMAEQRKKLMQIITVAVRGLDRLGELVPAIEAMGRRHGGYGVTNAHYDTVGEALLWTLEQGLGDEFTPEANDAWALTYATLAGVMQNAANRDVAA